jgi:catechol 2,3-dioxygenase-like lactoylglutathione lyase family enzyme
MFKPTRPFSGFSVDDIPAARQFYGETLGLPVSEHNGMLRIDIGAGAEVLVYPRVNHQPAAFTILNFPVADIESAVDDLAGRGIMFERYEGMPHDEKGIVRGDGDGPDIAWFTDPAGNVLSVLSDR